MRDERISTCTYAVRERSLDETFRLFAGAGFKKIDLWGGLPNFSLNPAECNIGALRSQAAVHGLTIANLGTYPGRRFLGGTRGDDELELQQMRRAIDVAVELGSRSIRVCPGHGEDRAMVDRLVPLFRQSAAYAAEKRVYLGMENHAGSLARFPDACVDLIARVGSPWFGVLFEPANLMDCGVDYKAAYGLFSGHVTHVHLKDGRRVDGRFQRTMLGAGEVDIPWVMRQLLADGYAGDFAVEYELETPAIDQGLAAWRRFVEELPAPLRRELRIG